MGRMGLAIKGHDEIFLGNLNVLYCESGGSF